MRTHAITFRLGAHEYEQLLKAMSSRGARSLSEFTRHAVLSSIVADSLDQFIEEELKSLMVSLDSFDMKVRDLKRQIRQLTLVAFCASPLPAERDETNGSEAH